jgi:hypothetical protein
LLDKLFLSPAQSVSVKPLQTAIFGLAVVLLLVSSSSSKWKVSAQKNKNAVPAGPLLTRTTPRHEVHRLLFGGKLSLSGAPVGSITIEGWERSEIDISAEIELHAATEDDLNRLAAINNFIVDEDLNHIRIFTTGTHDQKLLKRVAKDFPKSLIGLPWKIDYRIKVPAMTELEIDAGSGPISLAGVEGAIRLNALESEANLSLTGSLVSATVQRGMVNVTIPTRGWHGLGADIRLASGRMTVDLLPGFSGDINADVLRLGEIKNSIGEIEPRQSNSLAQRSFRGRMGNGGATLSFTVGEGTIEIRQSKQ